jgi:hypothetical protein
MKTAAMEAVGTKSAATTATISLENCFISSLKSRTLALGFAG